MAENLFIRQYKNRDNNAGFNGTVDYWIFNLNYSNINPVCVYMDISEYERAPMVDVYVRAMNDLIPDKVLFASAHPFVELADALEAYEAFDLTDEARRKVMYENARRVLGLS